MVNTLQLKSHVAVGLEVARFRSLSESQNQGRLPRSSVNTMRLWRV